MFLEVDYPTDTMELIETAVSFYEVIQDYDLKYMFFNEHGYGIKAMSNIDKKSLCLFIAGLKLNNNVSNIMKQYGITYNSVIDIFKIPDVNFKIQDVKFKKDLLFTPVILLQKGAINIPDRTFTPEKLIYHLSNNHYVSSRILRSIFFRFDELEFKDLSTHKAFKDLGALINTKIFEIEDYNTNSKNYYGPNKVLEFKKNKL